MKILNLIYSLIVGVLTSFLSRRHLKHHKAVGLAMAVSSYLLSQKFLKMDPS